MTPMAIGCISWSRSDLRMLQVEGAALAPRAGFMAGFSRGSGGTGHERIRGVPEDET